MNSAYGNIIASRDCFKPFINWRHCKLCQGNFCVSHIRV